MITPILLKDFYKVGHIDQYPKGTTKIVSNFTPRKSRMTNVNYSIFFGLKYFIEKYLDYEFDNNFFRRPYIDIMNEYKFYVDPSLGADKHYEHFKKLHDLGYLPIEIKSLPEGTVVPCGVPALVIYNTHPDFFWLPNMLETLLSCTLWGACTSATIAHEYRKLLDTYANQTSDIPEFVDYQAHDFSFRGMSSLESAMISGVAHLQYFKGSDTIPASYFRQVYYPSSNMGLSVPATEHSVMCTDGKESEFETIKRLITDIYPTGIISIVCDSWDFWKVVDEYLPKLKNIIMARDGKVVIRPDSGDPVLIITGEKGYSIEHGSEYNFPGLIERLWNIFGGTINSKGYKQLDPHIGAIYGDSITLDRAKDICERLKEKGFASTNIVFGVGSFTYQYNTRDTLGWAMKTTYAIVNGEERTVTKDPKTDDGTKKSHSGLLKVVKEDGVYKVLQNQSWEDFDSDENELKTVFKDGCYFL